MEETVLWLGCVYRNKFTDLREEIIKLLTRLNINFRTLDKEDCCGYPLILVGYTDEATKFAENCVKKLKDTNSVITSCPACYRSFKDFYPNLLKRRLPFDVKHSTQYYWSLIDKGVLKSSKLKPIKMKVMYHEPCELGRHSNIYDEPRNILNVIPGLEVYYPRFNYNLSACCGGGGLVSAYFPTLSSLAAARKLLEEDRIPKDLQGIVTECPQCISNLQQAWIEDQTMNIEFFNFAKLLNRALG
jgi:Fe-S oxidoreductase